MTEEVTRFKYKANTPAKFAAKLLNMRKTVWKQGLLGTTGLDEELEMIRDQFRRFVE